MLAAARFPRAMASIGSEMSMPTTDSKCCESSEARTPVPQPTSRTRRRCCGRRLRTKSGFRTREATKSYSSARWSKDRGSQSFNTASSVLPVAPVSDGLPTRLSLGRARVLRVTESQNRVENEWQENQPNRESHPFSKFRRKGHLGDDCDDQVHQGNEKEDQPPARLPGDLQQYPDVIDRNNRGPARLAGLLVHLHHRDDYQDNNGEINQQEQSHSCLLFSFASFV